MGVGPALWACDSDFTHAPARFNLCCHCLKILNPFEQGAPPCDFSLVPANRVAGSVKTHLVALCPPSQLFHPFESSMSIAQFDVSLALKNIFGIKVITRVAKNLRLPKQNPLWMSCNSSLGLSFPIFSVVLVGLGPGGLRPSFCRADSFYTYSSPIPDQAFEQFLYLAQTALPIDRLANSYLNFKAPASRSSPSNPPWCPTWRLHPSLGPRWECLAMALSPLD